jgi:hypothetical protein
VQTRNVNGYDTPDGSVRIARGVHRRHSPRCASLDSLPAAHAVYTDQTCVSEAVPRLKWKALQMACLSGVVQVLSM